MPDWNARRILVHQDLCSGCRACQVACVAQHESHFGTATARIHVTKIEPLGLDQPHVCRLCHQAPCLAACPAGALVRKEVSGPILVQAEDCIGCSACVDACPFGVATLHPETGVVLICDLCQGDPACVKRCATGAIVYTELDAGPRSKRQALTIEVYDGGVEGQTGES
jgi:Fe-S-cluster-containing dehydrogenase component